MIPDLSVLWVIAALLACTFLLNTLIFQPILRVIEARQQSVSEARQLAQTASDRAAAAATEYSQKLNAARSEVYRQMDDRRRTALDGRAAMLGETRAAVQQELDQATRRLHEQAAAARASLDHEAEAMADAVL
ncbi:MAG: ATP synthase F0 subunit B, partial [Acidobacteriota bacterium]